MAPPVSGARSGSQNISIKQTVLFRTMLNEQHTKQPNILMNTKPAFLSIVALAATFAVADGATSDVSLPELPEAPVLRPAKPVPPAKRTTRAKSAQPKTRAPAPRPQSASTEIDLSASQVLSAETEDGKPVFVVLPNGDSGSILFADNEGGGVIGNTYLRVGGGSLNRVGSKQAKPHEGSGSYMDMDASVSLTRLLSFRLVGMTLVNAEASGTYGGGNNGAPIRIEDGEFKYSSLHPMLVLSVNRNGILNPFAGFGIMIQRASVCDCSEWSSYDSLSKADPIKTGDLDGNGSFFAPTFGLEINVQRFHFSGECILSVGADKCQTNPFDTSKDGSDILYGGRASIGFSATDNLTLFASTTMTQAYHIFGAGVGWRF